MTTRNFSLLFALVSLFVFVSAAFAATPVIGSLDDLSSYGTWVKLGDNGMKTADGSTTTGEFSIPEDFTAQWWKDDANNGNIGKTGGNRTIAAGSVASVYDERTGSGSTVQLTVNTPEELVALTGCESIWEGNGISVAFTAANGYADGSTLTINFTGKVDTEAGVDQDLPITLTAPAMATVKGFDRGNQEITEITADKLVTSKDLDKYFTFLSEGTYGELVYSIPAYTKFWVANSWTNVSTIAGEIPAGECYETASTAQTTTWWPVAEEGNADPAITEYSAEQLVTREDLDKYFTFLSEGTYGELAYRIPAYTKFWVSNSWTNVSVQTGEQILTGQSYTTGNSAETVTWWPNQEWIDQQNTVEITQENINQYFTVTTADGSKWSTATPTAEAAGKQFKFADESKVTLVRNGSEITDPDSVNPEDGEVLIAEKTDVDNSDGQMFTNLTNLKAAVPMEPELKREDDGKWCVVFFCGADRLYLVGTNLFKCTYDTNTVEEVRNDATAAAGSGLGSKMLKSKTGRAIGTITVYLSFLSQGDSGSNQGNSDNGNSGQGVTGGSGGGGCSTTFGASLMFSLLPLFLRRKD